MKLTDGLEHFSINFPIILGISSSQLTNSIIFRKGGPRLGAQWNWARMGGWSTVPDLVNIQKATVLTVAIEIVIKNDDFPYSYVSLPEGRAYYMRLETSGNRSQLPLGFAR